jgi:hypothetical protein
MGFLEKNLPSGRFEQLKPGLLQTLRPSLAKDLSQLNLQEGAIKSFQGKAETEKKSLEEFKKEPESPTKALEATSPLPTQTPIVAKVDPKIISDVNKGDPKLLADLNKKQMALYYAERDFTKTEDFDEKQQEKIRQSFSKVVDSATSDQGPSKFANKFGGGAGSSISSEEAKFFKETLAYNATPNWEEVMKKSNKFTPARQKELKEGLMGSLPEIRPSRFLTGDYDKAYEDQKEKRNAVKAAEKAYEESKLTDAAASIEVSAATFKAGVDAFSQGTNQTLTAQFNVNFTGADFANDPKVAAELTAYVKTAWKNWVKESSGKEPVMAPGIPTVTAIA